MFCKILVAYDHSPESDRALETGIELAKLCGQDLYSITVSEDLPSYITMSYPGIPLDQGLVQSLDDKRDLFYEGLSRDAVDKAAKAGVTLHATITEGFESDAIVQHVKDLHADLLILGKHAHSALVDHLWGSTLLKIGLAAPCSILAVR